MAVCLAAGTATANASNPEGVLKVNDIQVGQHNGKLTLDIDIDPRAVNPGRDKEVVFIPVVRSLDSNDSIVLPYVTIAGRNRYYSHLRNNNIAQGAKVYQAGDKNIIQFRTETPWQPWMNHCVVDMKSNVQNCCQALRPAATTPLALLDYSVPKLDPKFRFVELTGDSAIELTAEGRAYVDFIVNRTEIRPTYRRNKIEIAKIIESIDKVKNDPDATITKITIKGFASPEGPYSNNVRLAIGRTASLKEYVREHYNFDPEIMNTDYEPEDWGGLREWVLECTLPHREEILQIIDSKMEPDPKNSEIEKRYPREYKLMLDSVYPGLRHSDYTVKYRIKAYATIDELLQVFGTAPERLRPVDFQRIATVYPVGSDNYNKVMLKAVEMHPYDTDANLNVATIKMKEGKLDEAQYYLNRAGNSPEAIYSRATLAAMHQDYTTAENLYGESAKLGFVPAKEELDRVQEIKNRPTVQYLIEPSGKR